MFPAAAAHLVRLPFFKAKICRNNAVIQCMPFARVMFFCVLRHEKKSNASITTVTVSITLFKWDRSAIEI
jgi:hypothetical protein